MEESIGGLLPRKQQEWEEDLERSGMNIDPAEVISREMERYMPSYLFLVLDPEPSHEYGGSQPKGRLAFYTRDDRPFITDEDGEMHWHRILPDNLPYVRLKVKELVPTLEVREGVEGYIVPLQESPSFSEVRDVVSYQRNLMFWESMLDDDEYGPMAGRFTFLAHTVYRMPDEQREESAHNWSETYRAIMQTKSKRRTRPKMRYHVSNDACWVEQQQVDIVQERIKELLAASEQARKEEALLHEKLSLQLAEWQQMSKASEGLGKTRNALRKRSTGM